MNQRLASPPQSGTDHDVADAPRSGATLLTPAQLKTLNRIGDLMIPGDAELPSFSASRCAEQADRMLAHMYDADRDGIRMLLGAFRFLPSLAVRGILRLCDHEASFPDLKRPMSPARPKVEAAPVDQPPALDWRHSAEEMDV